MKVNPNKAIEFLLARGNLPILYWLKKDILEVPIDREFKNLQKYASRIRILKSQKPNGGWCKRKYEGHPRWEKSYYIVDTLKNMFMNMHPHIMHCLLKSCVFLVMIKMRRSRKDSDGFPITDRMMEAGSFPTGL